jgi:pimeloyl-ACP methyl ester carboxylesterase
VRVDEHTIHIDGSPAFYRYAPVSGVPALYLHGVPTSSDDWTDFLTRTGGLAPDLPGFGRSGKAGNLDYSLEGLADFVERLLAELDVDRVDLVGHDWGAGAGLVFAQRAPKRVRRIALLNALPLLEGFHWHRLARAWRTPVVGELLMGTVNRWLLGRTLRGGSAREDAWSDGRLDAVWKQFDQGTQRAILRLYRDADEPRLAAAGAQLGQLNCPTLVLWGGRDPWLGAELADAYANRLSTATAEVFEDAGHWPWLDRAELVERVTSFLGSDGDG